MLNEQTTAIIKAYAQQLLDAYEAKRNAETQTGINVATKQALQAEYSLHGFLKAISLTDARYDYYLAMDEYQGDCQIVEVFMHDNENKGKLPETVFSLEWQDPKNHMAEVASLLGLKLDDRFIIKEELGNKTMYRITSTGLDALDKEGVFWEEVTDNTLEKLICHKREAIKVEINREGEDGAK